MQQAGRLPLQALIDQTLQMPPITPIRSALWCGTPTHGSSQRSSPLLTFLLTMCCELLHTASVNPHRSAPPGRGNWQHGTQEYATSLGSVGHAGVGAVPALVRHASDQRLQPAQYVYTQLPLMGVVLPTESIEEAGPVASGAGFIPDCVYVPDLPGSDVLVQQHVGRAGGVALDLARAGGARDVAPYRSR